MGMRIGLFGSRRLVRNFVGFGDGMMMTAATMMVVSDGGFAGSALAASVFGMDVMGAATDDRMPQHGRYRQNDC